jgi:hypothetical protein
MLAAYNSGLDNVLRAARQGLDSISTLPAAITRATS